MASSSKEDMPQSYPIPDPEVIAQTIRSKKVVLFTNLSQNIVDYAAGLIDADGEIQCDQISISQAQKGVECLHFMYDHFGGQVVALPHKDGENHQQAYEWSVFSDSLRLFAKTIVESLILKKREVIELIKYETLRKADRVASKNIIKQFKHVEHDPIPESVKPTDAYFAGFCDGEICFDCHGKTSQHHTISQSYRPICDVFERRFYGTTCWCGPPNNVFKWAIHTFADKFLKTIAPFIVGKKAQVELLLNMKPGEAADIHCKLRELKGNIGHVTTKIDRHLAGNGRVYVNPPKELPVGVHIATTTGKYMAIIKHNLTQNCLGTYNTVEEAEAQYIKYKELVEAEKHGGPVVDLEFNTVERKKNPPPAPDLPPLPSGIYLTKSNTFQVRWRNKVKGEKVAQLGTYKTVEDAVTALEAYKLSVSRNAYE